VEEIFEGAREVVLVANGCVLLQRQLQKRREILRPLEASDNEKRFASDGLRMTGALFFDEWLRCAWKKNLRTSVESLRPSGAALKW
jgi:hypothetical protein